MIEQLQIWHVLVGIAAINGLAALVLALRTGDTRAGSWAVGLGLLLAMQAGAESLVQLGYARMNILWWLSWLMLPGLLLPLAIAVANIGLLRRWVLALNALLLMLVLGLGLWLARALNEKSFESLQGFTAPAELQSLMLWALLLGGVALLDSLWQWKSAAKGKQKLRLGLLLLVLTLLLAGWLLDALVLSAYPMPWALPPMGIGLTSLGHLILFGLLWVQKGPRLIGSSLPPSVIRDSVQPILIADADGRVQAANDAAGRALDRSRSSMLGRHLSEVLGLEPDYLDTMTRLYGAAHLERIQVEIKAVKAIRELAVQPMLLRAPDGEVLAVVCSLHPGSEDPALAATSLLDPVTGLAGTALGEALIAQELHRHAGGSGPLVSAVFVRMDDTGVLASRLGQVLHDRLQSSIKERLEAVCDWPLDIARAAGGGYLILLSQVTDREEVLDIAARAQELLSQPFNLDDEALTPPVSIAVIPDLRVYHELIDVLEDARHGLAQARRTPGEPFICGERAEQRTGLALALEAAIAADGLDLQLQPVVDLRNGRAVGLRVLMRWAPEGTPAIEDAALRRLARRVHLEGPLNQWRLRQLVGMSFPKAWAIWLPTSLEELQTPNFIKAFPKSISRLPFKLIIEASDQVWQLPACRKIAADLCHAGLGLHGIEFTAGARLLTHAAGLEPRTVSLDPRLVQTHSPVSDAAVRGLAQTAKAMGAAMRAEGVRKKIDIKRLRSLGVPLVCGDYLSEAMQPAEFEQWLANSEELAAKLLGTEPAELAAKEQRRSPRA